MDEYEKNAWKEKLEGKNKVTIKNSKLVKGINS